jgi:hypothetical protein
MKFDYAFEAPRRYIIKTPAAAALNEVRKVIKYTQNSFSLSLYNKVWKNW